MKTITKKEWDEKHPDFKLVSLILDHKYWVLENINGTATLVAVCVS